MKKLILIVALALIWSFQYGHLFAQTTLPNPDVPQQDEKYQSEAKMAYDKGNKWAFKFSPQHILTNKLRVELERGLKDSRQSITVSPYMYFGTFLTPDEDDKLLAGGIEVMHKVYLSKYRRNLQGLYVCYGLNYLLMNFRIDDYGWKNEVGVDGLEYYNYDKFKQSLDIHRVGFDILVGYQIATKNNMIFDFYHGLGVKKHFSPQGDYALNRYNDDLFDYAANGPIFRIGVNIGFAFK